MIEKSISIVGTGYVGLCTRARDEFKQLEPEDFIEHMKIPLVIDGRRVYDSQKFSRRLKFAAIGLST